MIRVCLTAVSALSLLSGGIASAQMLSCSQLATDPAAGLEGTRRFTTSGWHRRLALAQEYGDEFDGFVVGAPAIYWQEFRLADAWPAIVVKDRLTAKGKTLSTAQFAAATRAAVAKCDVNGLDTVADGLIDDPGACTFSATANICDRKGAPGARSARRAS